MEKNELLAALWPNTVVEEANLTQSISTLRKLLNDNPKDHRYIATVPGRGYAFVAVVSAGANPAIADSTIPPKQERSPASSWRSKTLAGIAVALALAGGLIGYFRSGAPSREATFYSAIPLTEDAGMELSPSFAPDGERVAFAWDGPGRDNFDIYIKQIGVTQPVRLTDGPEPDISPAWSPDGRSIAFLHVGSASAEVSLIPAIGPGSRRVLTTVALQPTFYFRLRHICWSSDGKWLAIAAPSAAFGDSSLYLLSAEADERRRLTFPPLNYDDLDPALSPDMTHLAFVRYSSLGGGANGDIYVLNLSRELRPLGDPQRLTTFNRRTTSPAWTPDGKAILFVRVEKGGKHSLWRINLSDSKRIEPLAVATDNSSTMAISRAGDKIIYNRDSINVNIWGIEFDSRRNDREAQLRPWITSTATADNPQFSPDGRQIAYQSPRSGALEIWLCDRDGSNARQLTNSGAIGSAFPRWSPDGTQIVFQSRPKGVANLFVVNATGGIPRPLTADTANDVTPSWSRDGKWIYFTSRRSGVPLIWKLPAGGGTAVQVSKHGAFCPLESMDGKRLYFVALPEFELWKMPAAGGPETKVLSDVAGGSSFAPARKGIYFIRAPGQGVKQDLEFYSFAEGQTRVIGKISGRASFGMTVSPDERVLLFGEMDRSDSDLMLISHFH